MRHGESVANSENRIQGQSNSPLSETGREHAKAAARWLKTRNVDAVFTSPLARSTETAAIIAHETGANEPVVLDSLKELETGIYSGITLGQASKDDPGTFAEFRKFSWDAVPGAESRESLRRRALAVWSHLIQVANQGSRSIVCVSHGGMLQWIIKATIPRPGQRWMPVFGMANCGISVFTAQSTSHADDDLPEGTGYFANWDRINHVPY